jgi:hypothetical protein
LINDEETEDVQSDLKKAELLAQMHDIENRLARYKVAMEKSGKKQTEKKQTGKKQTGKKQVGKKQTAKK